MSLVDLLQIDPIELQFPFELWKQTSCSMRLTNKSEHYVAFKVMTTNPKKYNVRPNKGVVLPDSTCDVVVTMQAPKEAPSDMICGDKFLLKSVVVNPGVTPEDITAEMFNKESGNQVDECKLRVTYAMSCGDQLHIDRIVLQFPFELEEQIPCSMRLTNKLVNHVAFKVMTTHPDKYIVRPNKAVVLPHSTCDVVVTMEAQEETPSDMVCRDKFLIQSTVVEPGVSGKYITAEMFSKEWGNEVGQRKLSVAYVSPLQPPAPVQEGSELESE